eukprot:362101-Chlamydomonas_euryale.AAC.7
MDGVATREQLLCRLVENLSKKARPIDKEFGSATALSARLAEMEELGADVLVLIDNYGDLGRGPAATREDVCSVRGGGGRAQCRRLCVGFWVMRSLRASGLMRSLRASG